MFLRDILDSIQQIEEYTQGVSYDEFVADRQIQDATIRRLEIIGEAVKNLPNDIRTTYSDVPWREIAGMRDVLSHGYFGVKLSRVWNVVQNDLSHLAIAVQQILNDIEQITH